MSGSPGEQVLCNGALYFRFIGTDLLLVPLLAPRILRNPLRFWKICGDRRGAYSVLVGKHDVKRKLGSPRRRWKDIKIYLQEIERGGMQWIDLLQNRDGW